MKPRTGEVLPPEEPSPRELEHARLLARLLDDVIPIPGTPWRIGIDPLLGLVPGLGDLLGALLSSWLIVLAARMGAPRAVVTRMGLNVALETIVGIVPGLGDLFDAAWKANVRNLALLEAWQARPAATERASRARVAVLVALVLALAAAVVYGGWRLVEWAARGIGAG
jgi:hypothetical protein